MPTRVFTMYNLRPEASIEAFRKFSLEIDQPTCAQMPACLRFEVFVVKGEGSSKPFFQIVEDIEVESWEAWQDTTKSPAFARVNEAWPLLGDASSVVSIFCEKIEYGLP